MFFYHTRLIIPLAPDLDLFKISIILCVALCCVLKMACSLKHGVERCFVSHRGVKATASFVKTSTPGKCSPSFQ